MSELPPEEPGTPQHPVPDFEDPRDARQLREDGARTRRQREAMADLRGVRATLEEIVREHNTRAARTREVPQVGVVPPDAGGTPPCAAGGEDEPRILISLDVVLVDRAELERRDRPPTLRAGARQAPAAAAEAAQGEYPPSGPVMPREPSEVLAELGYVAAPRGARGEQSPVLRFERPPGGAQLGDEDRVRRTLRDAEALRDATGLPFSVSYVTTLGQIVKSGNHPGTTSITHVDPPSTKPFAGTDPVKVAVIDTGIVKEQRGDGWLTTVPRQPADEVVDPVRWPPEPSRIDFGGGHGTFVAGIVQHVAPASEIRVFRAVEPSGIGTEEDVAAAIGDAAAWGAQVINVSLGLSAIDDHIPPALLAAVQALAQDFPDTLVVASAGNFGDTTPVFPAAFKGVVAVGGLLDTGDPAPWSSRGFWVDCSVVGSGIVSTFVSGVLPTLAGPSPDVVFGDDAWAVWTGTSFAAPQITGLVARIVQLSTAAGAPGGPLTPRQAFGRVMAGRRSIPGFGHTLRVLPGTPE